MIAEAVPYILAIVAFATYVLQLWTGVAFAGWAGENSIVERENRPRRFGLVMAVQSVVLIIGFWLWFVNG